MEEVNQVVAGIFFSVRRTGQTRETLKLNQRLLLYRYLPTKKNRAMAQLKSKMDNLLREVIKDRQKALKRGEAKTFGNDLLGIMLAAASDGTSETAPEFNLASVFNNTKLFFFAGQDTVASALTFTFLQLARYPEWQEKAHQEVLEVLGESTALDSDSVSKLKVVRLSDPSFHRLQDSRKF